MTGVVFSSNIAKGNAENMPHRQKPYRTRVHGIGVLLCDNVYGGYGHVVYFANFKTENSRPNRTPVDENPAGTYVHMCGDDNSLRIVQPGHISPRNITFVFGFKGRQPTRRRTRFPANPNTGPCAVYLVDVCLRTRTCTFFPLFAETVLKCA